MPKPGIDAFDSLGSTSLTTSHSLSINPEQSRRVDLKKIKSENLVWLTETEDQAREYGEASQSDLKDYRVIARDSEGGVLVEKLNMRRIRGLIAS